MTEKSMSGPPDRRSCLLCGERLPKASWLARITGTAPPTHSTKGPEGDACWAKLNERLGIEDPGPRPT